MDCQVKQLNDFMFLIVPFTCPRGEGVHCESCAFSRVQLRTSRHCHARAQIQVGFVSCSLHEDCLKSA